MGRVPAQCFGVVLETMREVIEENFNPQKVWYDTSLELTTLVADRLGLPLKESHMSNILRLHRSQGTEAFLIFYMTWRPYRVYTVVSKPPSTLTKAQRIIIDWNTWRNTTIIDGITRNTNNMRNRLNNL